MALLLFHWKRNQYKNTVLQIQTFYFHIVHVKLQMYLILARLFREPITETNACGLYVYHIRPWGNTIIPRHPALRELFLDPRM